MLASGLRGLGAASLLIVAPTIAQAQSAVIQSGTPQSAAQRLSIASAQPVRAGAPANATSRANGGNWSWIIGAAGLVAGVTYALVEGDDDDRPASP